MKRIPALFLLCFVTASLYADAALDYLNSMREKAGLVPFVVETHLQQAAQNHSDYMQTNNISGHYEDSSKSGFTGVSPLDRAQNAGYSLQTVSENVSWEMKGTYYSSIDSLFSAIYHRYGFLAMNADVIGIGVNSGKNGNFYTYDMGFVENHKDESPDIIIWPPENGTDIPPVFYEESPDPLPDASVSGYPVSVEFNSGKYATSPVVSDLTIEDLSSGALLGRITFMKKENDPNDRLTDYQAASFPTKRLEWGHVYRAELTYSSAGDTHMKSWHFKTRTLKGVVNKFYRIEGNQDISLNVVSGKTYGIYVVPNDMNDRLGGVSYRYNTSNPSFSYIDQNTISVRVTGDQGSYVEFTFDNGQKIMLTIDDTDTAILPEDEDVSAWAPIIMDGVITFVPSV